MFSLFVTSNRPGGGATIFGTLVHAVVLATFVPFSTAGWGLIQPAHGEAPHSRILLPVKAPASPPERAGGTGASTFRPLPEEVMSVLVGGPEPVQPAVNLAAPEMLLAGLASTVPPTLLSGVSSHPTAALTTWMDTVITESALGNVAGVVLTALPVLSHYPDSHESRQARMLLRNHLSKASSAVLKSLASSVMALEAPATSAAGEAVCRIVHQYAATFNEPAGFMFVADTAQRVLSAWPNAPEAYTLVPLYLGALAALGRLPETDGLVQAVPGTLAAWRITALRSDAAPAWETLSDAEAKYGLLAAWYDEVNALERAGVAPAALAADSCALADLAVWSHPVSAVQTRIVPLYFDLLKRLDLEDRADRVHRLTRQVDAAPSSVSVWMTRIFLYGEYLWHLHDLQAGSFHLLNAFDDLQQGHVEAALRAPETTVRDKARMEYYLGYMKWNRGSEAGAIYHYERALAYETSDVIRDTALYARAYALEALYDYQGAFDQSVEGYRAYLAEHAYGHNAEYALFGLARIYERAEDLEGARYFFEHLIDTYPQSRVLEEARREAARLAETPLRAYARGAGAASPDRQMCGPVALQKLMALSSIEADVEELAALAQTDASGTTMQGLVEAARAKGFPLAGVQAPRGTGLEAPYIAFVNSDHFVVVQDSGEKGFLVDDTHARAPEWLPREVFLSFWDGMALVSASAPALARVMTDSDLEEVKGGSDPVPDPNHMECKNWEFCCPCPTCAPPPPPTSPNPPSPSPPTDPGLPPDQGHCSFMGCESMSLGMGIHGPGGPDGGATNPSKCAQGANPKVMLFQTSPVLRETDLRMSTVGGLNIALTRHFANQFGFMRAWYSTWPSDKPYKNHIGNSWSHNYNMHLRVTEQYGAVQFVDEQGDIKTYTWNSQDSAYAYYTRRVTAEHEYHGWAYNGHPWEEGTVLKRHLSTGVYTLHLPDGMVYGFSAETAWPEHYARLEYIQSRSGEQLTMQYDGQGRLSQVLPPTGDDRYLKLNYSGNRVVSAQLRTASAVLETVVYEYDQYLSLIWVHRGNPSNPDNGISIYAYGSDGNVPNSFFMTSKTDGAGVTTGMAYAFETIVPWGIQATEMTLQRGNLLKTHYRRFGSTQYACVKNLNENDQPINKIEYVGDFYAGNLSMVRMYLTPSSSTSFTRWSYTYSSPDKFLIQVHRPTNTSGGTTLYEEYTYTPEGKFASVARIMPGAPNGRLTTTYDYDASGLLLTRRTDPGGLETEYSYDSYGRVIQVTHPSLGVNGIQYTYDSQGNRASVTDPLGKTTSFTYDSRGNMIALTNALNQTTAMTYDDLGRATSVTDPLNNTTEYEYVSGGCGCGGTGKLARVTDALNYETTFAYDLAGNMILTTDALNRSTAYEYDALGRLTAIESPAGSDKRMIFTYNRLGHTLSTTDFMGRTTTMTYNHQGHLASTTDATGTVSYAYNAAGRVTSVTDETGKVTTVSYDGGLRPTFEMWGTYGNTKYRWFYYDAQGRTIKVGGGIGATVDPTEFFYSQTTGLRTKTRYWSGGTYHDADYVYDDAARLTRINDWLDATVGIQYAYDALGRLDTLTDYAYNKQVSYTYDAAGRIASMTDYNGHTTTYAYTARGELASITVPGGKVWTFAYNALGQRTQYTHPNGTRTEYVYDTENRLTGILHKDASTDAVLDSFAYTLNDGGNITRMDHADNSYWAYGYDTRNRLTSARRYNTLGGLLHWFNYTYDAADNMTQRWRFQMSNSQMDTWNFTYNSANEQVSMTLNGGTPETFTYDALGRLTTRTQGSYSASYGYRYNSRLYQATSNFPGETNVTLDYGGDGKLRTRITADETRRYRYAMGYNAIHEEHDDGGGILATNVFEPGASNGPRLAQMMFGTLTGGLPVYAWHDHLGTVRQWRFANKNSARAIEYDPYGNNYAQSGFFNMPRIYALHEFDSALKQYRAPFRHYRPAMARWTTPDPLGMIDGPNMYGYVGGNPVDNSDFLGLHITMMHRDPYGSTRLPSISEHEKIDPCTDNCLSTAERIADNVSKRYQGGDGNIQDHMRHCVWNCELTRAKGRSCAWVVTTAYEFLKSDKNPFDLESNRRGRKCGKTPFGCDACCRYEGRKRHLVSKGAGI